MRFRRRSLLLSAVAILTVAGLAWSTPAAGGTAAIASATTPSGRGEATPVANVWVTSPDRQFELSDQGTVPFTRANSDLLTITVDPSRTFQTMKGFGASLTDSSATVLYRLDQTERDAATVKLFDPQRGVGLSYLRQPMGASDFVATAHYTYDLGTGVKPQTIVDTLDVSLGGLRADPETARDLPVGQSLRDQVGDRLLAGGQSLAAAFYVGRLPLVSGKFR